jgi:hypothetical protein
MTDLATCFFVIAMMNTDATKYDDGRIYLEKEYIHNNHYTLQMYNVSF